MDFQFNPGEETLYNQIADLCRQHLPAGLDQPGGADRDAALKDYPEALYQALAEAGALELPGYEENGVEWSNTSKLIVTEATAASSYTAMLMYIAGGPVAAMLQWGCTPKQIQRWRPDLIAGRASYTFALVEPEAGSDLTALSCVAEPAADGYILNGHKTYVTGAAHVDHVAVVARAPGDANIREATSVFMVPTDAPGLSMENMELSAGRSVGCADVHLKDVKVGEDLLLGAENEAWGAVTIANGHSRLLVSAGAVGLARSAFARALEYARDRKQFGKPIGRFQSISHRLAEMATEIEAMRLLTYQAASLADQGDIADKQIAMAKVYCSEKLGEIVISAQKIMGGRACLRDEATSRKLDETMFTLVQGGTNEVLNTYIKKCLDLGQ